MSLSPQPSPTRWRDRSDGEHGLSDDVLTLGAPTHTVRAYLSEAVDRLAGADPGLTQLRNATQAVLGIALAVGLVDVFVHATGSLQLRPGDGAPAVVLAYNHALLIVSMLLAGIVALMAGFTVGDSTARGQLISSLILPLPMIAAMALGLALGPYRVPSLVFLVALLSGAIYVRRWGPRGFAAGLVAFNGGFLGFFLHREIGLRDLGWLAADVLIGLCASLAVRFGLFRPNLERTLGRMRRSWEARVRRLLSLSMAVLATEDAPERTKLVESLRRQNVRLNESTLMIDAQLAQAAPRSATVEAQRLFDAELALSNCTRFATALRATGAAPALRAEAIAALGALRDEDWEAATGSANHLAAVADALDQPVRDGVGDAARDIVGNGRGASRARTTVLCHRLGASVREYQRARAALREAVDDILIEAEAGFTPAVALTAGFLPGSLPVSTAASTTAGRGGRIDRATMPPYVRAAIQAGVAGTLAVVVGDLVSGSRLYWAVLSTFLAFMATTNSGEQVRKALFRVAGTAVGIVIGDLLVHVTGGYIWTSMAIVLVALFFGIYLIRINYTFMVIGVTVTMSQLYKQLGEFSWHLLLLRFAETAIGVGAVVVTVLVIVPLRPQRVLTTGVLLWFQSLRALLDATMDRLLGGPALPLRAAVRELDASYAALEATAAPLRHATFGRNSDQLSEIQSVAGAARGYARSLAAVADAPGRSPAAGAPSVEAGEPAGSVEAGEPAGSAAAAALADSGERAGAGAAAAAPVPAAPVPAAPGPAEFAAGVDEAALRTAADQLRTSCQAIEDRISTGRHSTYVRVAALLDLAAPAGGADRSFPLALRDLTLLDGALARLATALHMEVTDFDT